MARGGARPGAGRPRKGDQKLPKPAKGATQPEVPEDVEQDAVAAGMSPLDYMLSVMRDGRADAARRDRMAMAAAPFVHARPGDSKPGKKEAAAKKADAVAGGKFGARPAPLKLVNGGG